MHTSTTHATPHNLIYFFMQLLYVAIASHLFIIKTQFRQALSFDQRFYIIRRHVIMTCVKFTWDEAPSRAALDACAVVNLVITLNIKQQAVLIHYNRCLAPLSISFYIAVCTLPLQLELNCVRRHMRPQGAKLMRQVMHRNHAAGSYNAVSPCISTCWKRGTCGSPWSQVYYETTRKSGG